MSIIPVFIPVLSVQYVKKEDVYSHLTTKREALGIMLFALAIVNVIVALVIFPSLQPLYPEYISLTLPFLVPMTVFPHGLIFLGLINIATSVYCFSNKLDKQEIEGLISSYKDGEMISVKRFKDVNLGMPLFSLLGLLSILYLMLSFLVPMESMLSSI